MNRDLIDSQKGSTMRQEFVEFQSPGTFVSEVSRHPVETRDVDAACELARTVTERHGATPYGFRFVARERADDELDAHDVDHSPMYYLGGVVETLEEVEARATDDDRILISNMKSNGWSKIITNTNSWRITRPFLEDDVLLDFEPAKTGTL